MRFEYMGFGVNEVRVYGIRVNEFRVNEIRVYGIRVNEFRVNEVSGK